MTPPKESDAVELGGIGIAHLNTGGIKHGEMFVITSGRPSRGKSLFFEALLAEEKARLQARKGTKGGNCNVTACQRPGAVYFNKSTKRYYCAGCAEQINWPGGRADTMELYGVPLLCELDEPNENAALIMTITKRRVSNDLFSFDDLLNQPFEPREKKKAQWKREVNRGRR